MDELTVFMCAVSVAVMSVDLGSEWMKMAIVKPGVPMEIVLNKYVPNVKALEISNPFDILLLVSFSTINFLFLIHACEITLVGSVFYQIGT